jgi:hypothetical protein
MDYLIDSFNERNLAFVEVNECVSFEHVFKDKGFKYREGEIRE